MASKKSKRAENFERLLSAARQRGTSTRHPWRHRTCRVGIKLTYAEKARRKANRALEKETYREGILDIQKMIYNQAALLREKVGKHSVTHIVEDIMQTHRHTKNKKKAGRFNAFVCTEMRRLNSELPEGVTRFKVNECMAEISGKWSKMTAVECVDTMDVALKELEDDRQNREWGTHNVAISSFHDTCTTLDSVKEELTRLQVRTGTEVVMLAMHSSSDHFTPPEAFSTSNRAGEFFNLAFKQLLSEVVVRFEGYMISGIEGVARNYTERLLEKKRELKDLIMQKLSQEECAGKTKVKRMFYHDFDGHVTENLGIVVRNWPLKVFCSPADVKSRVKLDVLYNTWVSRTTHFYRMTNAEFEAWKEQRFNTALQITENDAGNEETTSTVNIAGSTVPVGSTDPSLHSNAVLQAPPSNNSLDQATPSTMQTDTAAQAPTPLSSAHTAMFVNSMSVTGANGETVLVTQRKRAKRSDAGQKRKSKKQRLADAENAGMTL